jgi:hypothetical protein
MKEPAESLLTVQIVNLYGQQVHQSSVPAGVRQHIMDVSNLAAGVYWISLRNDSDEIYGTKLVITD